MKTITRIFVTTLVIFSLNIHAQKKSIKANGNIITTTRTVSNFDKLSVSGSFDITLIEGKEGEISIKTSENLMDIIVTEVKEGTLNIKFEKGVQIKNVKTIQITVAYKTIEAISLAGSGDIKAELPIITNDLTLGLSGSGNIKLAIETNNLTTSIAGSGNINLTGKTGVFTCSISGSGNINAQELTSNVTNAKISGSGNIKVYVENEIQAKTSGSGNIIYTGNPTIIKANSSGSGSVNKRN